MSAKTSPSNSRDGNVAAAAGVVPPSVAGGVIQIKKELPSDEIKEFAQHTMNELLGWYGFDGVDVDRLDLTAKTSRLLQSAAAAAVATQQQQQQQQQQLQQQQQQQQQQRSHLRSSRSSTLAAAFHNNNNNNNSSNNNNNNSSNNNNNNNSNCNNRKASSLNCHSNTTTPSDHDTRSSREDDSKSPHSIGKPSATGLTTSHTEEKIDYNNCCWCHRPIPENAPDYLTSTDGPRYCSESCFTQSRRASFKKAKTCDWCKHVRHAVSYVDFQDGASQLQFCSEKCLNQYKMQIFCNETQAHLDMNPHLRDQGLEAAAAGDGAGLITPDLWLRNCRSRSASPASTISVSPGPAAVCIANASKRSSPCHTPPTHPSKPLISVAPVSKLLAQKTTAMAGAPHPPAAPLQRHHALHSGSKPGRRKRPHRAVGAGSETVASLLHKQQQQQQQQQQPPTLSADFGGSSVPLPPLSPMQEQQPPQPLQSQQQLHQQQQQQQPQPQSQQQPHPQPLPPAMPCRPATGLPAGYFATPPNGVLGHPFGARPAPPPPHPFLAPPPGMFPRGFGAHFGPPPQLHPQLQPEMHGALGALLGTAPPVTVMVPYPIIIPLPIPIPVPLPVVDFYKAHLTPEQRKRYDDERRGATSGGEEQPQPLDCSKAKPELEKEVEEQPMEEEHEQPIEQKKEQEQGPESEQEREQKPEQKPDQEPDQEEEEKPIPKTRTVRTTPSPATSPVTDSSPDMLGESTHCVVLHNVESDAGGCNASSTAEAETQKLPKLKITRLQTKRTLIQTKEIRELTPSSPTAGGSGGSASAAECTRPLRKRKRIIDCDFQKITLRELDAVDAHNNNSNSNSNSNSSSSNNHNNNGISKEEEEEREVCNINSSNSAKITKK